MTGRLLRYALAAFGPGLALASPAAVSDPGFAACVDDLAAAARAEGVSAPVVEQVLGRVDRNVRVIELDRRQPEFVLTFAGYLGRRVTDDVIAHGETLLAEHAELLARIQRSTGVPARYLVAIWGLESNYGRYFGEMWVPNSLATLACDQRRSTFFTHELVAALEIIDAGDISADRMQGSWAGAMGHMQFMPSVFLRNAVDADGDGQRDLWGSVPDAMASAANYLKRLGWVPALRWGREVLLPEPFDYMLAGSDGTRPLADWSAAGITDVFGNPLPALALEATLRVPAGHRGPAFLTYENFDVLMRWNRSELYALAVGHLADRLVGVGALRNPPPADGGRMSRARIQQLQLDLVTLGFDAGEPDGVLGPRTRGALRRFQHANGLVADGYPALEVLEAVHAAATDALPWRSSEVE